MKRYTLILMAISLVIVSACARQEVKVIENVPEIPQEQCQQNAIYFIFSDPDIYGKYDQTLLQVKDARCSRLDYYSQWELEGTYDNRPLYFHAIRGGMAASGADTYSEFCLKIGDETISSKIQVGRDLRLLGPARCAWQTETPAFN